MVKFSIWPRTALDPRIYSDLPMSGEGTGLGVPTPALAGYLGKATDTFVLTESCPLCVAKGQTHALRSYRISFQESVILCTNRQCLFPLVSKPLEDVLADHTSREIKAGLKRKCTQGTDEGYFSATSKRRREGLVCPCSEGLSHNSVTQKNVVLCGSDSCAMSNGPSRNPVPSSLSKGVDMEELGVMPMEEVVSIAPPAEMEPTLANALPIEEEPTLPLSLPSDEVEGGTMAVIALSAAEVEEEPTPVIAPSTAEVEEEPTPVIAPSTAEVEEEPTAVISLPAAEVEEEPTAVIALSTAEVEEEPTAVIAPSTAEVEEEPTPVISLPAAEVEEEPTAVIALSTAEVEEEPTPVISLPAAEVEEEPTPVIALPAAEVEEEPTPVIAPSTAEVEEEPTPVIALPAAVVEEEPTLVIALPAAEVEEEPTPVFAPSTAEVEEEPTPVIAPSTAEVEEEPTAVISLPAAEVEEEPTPAISLPAAEVEEEPTPVISLPAAEVEEEPTAVISLPAAEVEEELKPAIVPPTELEEPRSLFPAPPSDELVLAPSLLFWKNKHSLCWLDTLLVALVHCQTLREFKSSLCVNKSYICKLLAGYDRAVAVLKAKEQVDKDVVRVPSSMLQEAQRELEDLRMSTFKLLKTKLHCKLGERETPVFALPLLLRQDAEAEVLFRHAFEWEFECAACGHTFRNRCEKTVTTFTQVAPDWHPLNAVHRSPCSRCHCKLQRRKMLLERVPPVFVLHFVEGLPRSDLSLYSFDLVGKRYTISTVIQYDQKLLHFVTWIRTRQGSWLEFDDLKYPECRVHEKLPIPADQIHVVFWEVQRGWEESVSVADTPDLSFSFPQDDTYIVSALMDESLTEASACVEGPDASINSTTLLDTFEGLSHSDIVTLTLVEVKVDSEGKPLGSSPGLQRGAVPDPCIADTKIGSPALETPARDAAQKPSKPQAARRRGRRPSPRQKKGTPAPSASELPSADTPHPGNATPAFPGAGDLKCLSATLSIPSNARWTNLLSKHPSLQPAPLPQRCVMVTPPPRPLPTVTGDEAFPVKAAEMFGGFKSKGPSALSAKASHGNAPCQTVENSALNRPLAPSPAGAPQKPSSKQVPSQTAVQKDLRHRLMKKLKEKKKKLASLNLLLGKKDGELLPAPDSTDLNSPLTVSSSTTLCNSPSYDAFFEDLLSPATTASNLSPDSTGLLEMLAGGQDGSEVPVRTSPCSSYVINPASAGPGGVGTHRLEATGNGLGVVEDSFLDEFMSGASLQPGVTESAEFNGFDLFF